MESPEDRVEFLTEEINEAQSKMSLDSAALLLLFEKIIEKYPVDVQEVLQLHNALSKRLRGEKYNPNMELKLQKLVEEIYDTRSNIEESEKFDVSNDQIQLVL